MLLVCISYMIFSWVEGLRQQHRSLPNPNTLKPYIISAPDPSRSLIKSTPFHPKDRNGGRLLDGALTELTSCQGLDVAVVSLCFFFGLIVDVWGLFAGFM